MIMIIIITANKKVCVLCHKNVFVSVTPVSTDCNPTLNVLTRLMKYSSSLRFPQVAQNALLEFGEVWLCTLPLPLSLVARPVETQVTARGDTDWLLAGWLRGGVAPLEG